MGVPNSGWKNQVEALFEEVEVADDSSLTLSEGERRGSSSMKKRFPLIGKEIEPAGHDAQITELDGRLECNINLLR
ncbi:hypothetical protein KIN20_025706 [Parelaphostrongylus tenuis]|uniref:Uncharacterized protein n=1 Tax=Parelaphostrongylus tenuis TaxID=148309 RepID=A0AAD5MVS7_PARTN|nr:hypothetical protein KIN20_025706 [Parelaphostrongylus tenuis]